MRNESASPGAQLSVQVEPRCIAGKAYLSVRATNEEDSPVDIVLDTPFGQRTATGVARDGAPTSRSTRAPTRSPRARSSSPRATANRRRARRSSTTA
ncbi:hypothetical protein NKG05_04995 [Oerskovia sp. M15]